MGGAELPTTVDLCWIPLGAGQHVVRLSGKLFEAVSARVQTRSPCDLYHSALVVVVPEGRFVIEQTPVIDGQGDLRGVVLEGPVGTRLAGRFRLFRYEVRRWRDGVIPDVAEAVSTVRVADDPVIIGRILDLVPSVPPLVWGRDHGRTGDMWNSNSVISWLLARAGVDAAGISPPPRGRAPGWHAGIVIAARDAVSAPVLGAMHLLMLPSMYLAMIHRHEEYEQGPTGHGRQGHSAHRGRSFARFNRSVANLVTRLFAGWVPPFAVVRHCGRMSGREYATPVWAFATRDGLVFALLYGSVSDWAKNVLAAEGASVMRHGKTDVYGQPRLVAGNDGLRLVPAILRPPLRLFRVRDVLRVSLSPGHVEAKEFTLPTTKAAL